MRDVTTLEKHCVCSNYSELSMYRIQPDDIGAHINVGRTLNSLQLYSEAEQAYRTALALLPPVKPGLLLLFVIRHIM